MPIVLGRVIEQFVDFCHQTKRRVGSSSLDNAIVRHQLADWRVEVEMERMLSYRVG